MMRVLKAYREAYSGLPPAMWMLAGVLFINRCGTMVLAFLVLYLTGERGFSEGQAGGVLSMYGLGAILGVMLGGWLTDRIGFVAVMVGSLFTSGLAFVGYGFLESSLALHVGAVVLGLLAESFRPANGAAVAALAPPELRARAFGLNRLALNLGWTVAPLLAGFLAAVDFGWLFWADGATCIVAGIMLAYWLPKHAGSGRGNTSKSTADRSPWRDALFMGVFFFMMLQMLVFFQIHSTFSLVLRDERGFSMPSIGALFMINTVLIVVFEMPLVRHIERRSPLHVMGLAALCVGLGFGLMPLSGSPLWVVSLVVLWTLGEMLFAPMGMAWVAGRATEANRGAYMAAFAMAFSISVALAPLWGTHVLQVYGSGVLWGSCLAMGLLSAVGFLGLARKSKRTC